MGIGYKCYIYYGIYCEFDDLLKMFPNLEKDIKQSYQDDLNETNNILSEYSTVKEQFNVIDFFKRKIDYYEKRLKNNINTIYFPYDSKYDNKSINQINIIDNDDIDDNDRKDFIKKYFSKNQSVNVYVTADEYKESLDYDEYLYKTYIVGYKVENNDNINGLIETKKKLNMITDKEPTFIIIDYSDT